LLFVFFFKQKTAYEINKPDVVYCWFIKTLNINTNLSLFSRAMSDIFLLYWVALNIVFIEPNALHSISDFI